MNELTCVIKTALKNVVIFSSISFQEGSLKCFLELMKMRSIKIIRKGYLSNK